MRAIFVDADPHDVCSADVDQLLRFSADRPLRIGASGNINVVVGADGRGTCVVDVVDGSAVLTTAVARATSPFERGAGAEPELLRHGARFTCGGVTFGFVDDVGAPLELVHRCGGWLVIDALRVDRWARQVAFRRRDGALELACLVRAAASPRQAAPAGAIESWRDGDTRVSAVKRPRGVNLVVLLGRAGALEPMMAAHIARTLIDAPWLVDVDVGFDGSIAARPPLRPASAPDEVTRLHALLSLLLPSPVLQQLRADGVVVDAVLDSALSYDTFDALIVGSAVEDALRALKIRSVDAAEIGAVVRGLFPDAWRAEQELLEQLATLDEEDVRRLAQRG